MRTEPALLEQLEQRSLLSFTWTAEEVYLAELVNRARANPAVEGLRLGLDLTAGLSSAEAARLVPQEPLALNWQLTAPARVHSVDMAQRNFFDHVNPSGQSPTDRAQAFGYPGTAGENIAAGFSSLDDVHRAWLNSVGHRKNVLSLHSSFDANFHYDELGIGIALNAGGTYGNYYTQMFGYQGSAPKKYLLGVIYDDTNANDFYTVGEGMAGIRIDVATAAAPGVVVKTATTSAAGNYQIDVAPGSYVLTFTVVGDGRTYSASATVGDVNVKVDVLGEQFEDDEPPPPPHDDHANASQWSQASVLVLYATTGNGTINGEVESPDDSDLFVFTAPKTGQTRVLLQTFSTQDFLGLNGRLQLFNSAGTPIGVGVPVSGDDRDAVYEFNVVAGQSYYLLVSAESLSVGGYIVQVTGPTDIDPGDGGALDPDDLLGRVGLPVMPGATPDGHLIITYLANSERPIYAQKNPDGSWTKYDLLSVSGGPNTSGAILSWIDPKDELKYAAAVSSQGLILFSRSDAGSWTFRNLNTEIGGSKPLGGKLVQYVDAANRIHIAGIAADGDLIVYQQNGGTIGSGEHKWIATNVSRQLSRRGIETPDFSGGLTAWVTPRRTINIAGIDTAGDIRLIYKQQGPQYAWQLINLSDFVGIQATLTGSLSSYQTADRGIGIAGVDTSGKVWLASWSTTNGWRATNVSGARGIRFTPGTLTTWVNTAGFINIGGLNSAGKLNVFFRAGTSNGSFRLGVVTNSVPTPGDRHLLTGALNTNVASTGRVTITGLRADGAIIAYSWLSGEGWSATSLTAELA